MTKSQIHMNFDTDELEFLKRMAKAKGCSVTWYLRDMVQQKMAAHPKKRKANGKG